MEIIFISVVALCALACIGNRLTRRDLDEAGTYTVYYRKYWFWRKITGVSEDGFITERFANYGIQYGMRYFIKADHSSIEIPASCQFKFPPRRNTIVEKNKQRAELDRMGGDKNAEWVIGPN